MVCTMVPISPDWMTDLLYYSALFYFLCHEILVYVSVWTVCLFVCAYVSMCLFVCVFMGCSHVCACWFVCGVVVGRAH